MTTTTTMTEAEARQYRSSDPCTYCGITAPRQLWTDLGYVLYSNADYPSRRTNGFEETPTDLELTLAIEKSGHADGRALAWLMQYRDERKAEKTRSTAIARAAEAGLKMADALQNIDARLRVYIGEEVRRVLQR